MSNQYKYIISTPYPGQKADQVYYDECVPNRFETQWKADWVPDQLEEEFILQKIISYERLWGTDEEAMQERDIYQLLQFKQKAVGNLIDSKYVINSVKVVYKGWKEAYLCFESLIDLDDNNDYFIGSPTVYKMHFQRYAKEWGLKYVS